MGAHSFLDITDLSDPEQGFFDLKEEARSNFGNDPYNGTISTVSGFSRSERYADPVPSNCLRAFGDRVWADEREGLVPEIQKWSSCLAVPLAQPDSFQWEEREFTFEVQSDGSKTLSPQDARKMVYEQLKDGELATDIEVEKLTPEREVKLEETEVGAGQMFGFAIAVLTENGPRFGSLGAVRLYEARDEAVEAARKMAKMGNDYTVVEIRGSGFTCGPVKSLDLYRVTYRVPRALASPEISGWAFIGLASS